MKAEIKYMDKKFCGDPPIINSTNRINKIEVTPFERPIKKYDRHRYLKLLLFLYKFLIFKK